MWEKNEREENDATESLYFGNDFVEIGESWGKKKICLILVMVLLKNERGERKNCLHFHKIGGREAREKNLSLCFIWLFFNLSKIYPTVL